MNPKKILIIGAGPGGLAMAGRLRQSGIPFDLVEQSDKIAWSWCNHYDRLKLHTVKKHSNLPGMAFPENYPKFISRDQLIKYYQEYADAFSIKPEFNSTVEKCSCVGDDWEVTINGTRCIYSYVVVATGVNRVPVIPEIEGIVNYKGKKIHSRNYRNPEPYKGLKVLVVGMGNTGAEIALDIANTGVETDLSVRGPVNIVPLEFMGNATQETALLLSKLPKSIGRFMSNLVQRLTVGDLSGYGIEKPKIAASDQLSETGKTPVIDLGTVRAIKQGKIVVRKEIKSIGSNHVTFSDKTQKAYDCIIFCTGYRSALGEFIPDIQWFLDKNGNPSNVVGTKDLEGLFFVGYNLFEPGGGLGLIRKESKIVLDQLKEVFN